MNRKNLWVKTVKALVNWQYDYSLNESSVQFCIHLLKNISNIKFLKKLNAKLKKSSNEWIKEFVCNNGIFVLLEKMEKYSIIYKQHNQSLKIFDSII